MSKQASKPEEDREMTLEEAAVLASCSVRTIERHIAAGRLKARRNRRVVVLRADVEKLLAGEPTPAAG
jgi:excisionase family DNA binding protein